MADLPGELAQPWVYLGIRSKPRSSATLFQDFPLSQVWASLSRIV